MFYLCFDVKISTEFVSVKPLTTHFVERRKANSENPKLLFATISFYIKTQIHMLYKNTIAVSAIRTSYKKRLAKIARVFNP